MGNKTLKELIYKRKKRKEHVSTHSSKIQLQVIFNCKQLTSTRPKLISLWIFNIGKHLGRKSKDRKISLQRGIESSHTPYSFFQGTLPSELMMNRFGLTTL